ncbi:Non-specific serine/threonine protein kinase [Aphelenchoides besseyi]|nr:Non-specific serine/threonine protein kinase [Aphelenchoides besseyi]
MRIQLIILLILFSYFPTTRSDVVIQNSAETTSGYNAGGTILVSTIDGYLTAVDMHSGAIKWRYKEGPVLDSSKYLQADFSYIPNPRNGDLYVISDKQLKRLPFNIPQLVTVSPCKSSDGILYSGQKKDVWIAINPDTGVHRETVPPQATDSCPVGHPETVFIGRTDYRVFMSDTKRTSRNWNATFVDYSSHLLPVDEEYPFRHFHSSADGRILTIDTTTQDVRWKLDFQSVIVNLYLLKQDGMHRLPSTSVGQGTFDIFENSPQLVHFFDWTNGPADNDRTMSNDARLLQTLFIGDSDFGLYALNSFVDQKLDSFLLKTLGPLLLEGPTGDPSENAAVPRPPLPKGADLHGSIYRTTSGEFLLLGHHDIPPTLMKAIISGRDTQFNRLSLLGFEPHSDSGNSGSYLPHRIDSINTGENKDSDVDWAWEVIFVQAWRKSPLGVLTFIGLILGLIIAAVFFYAKHNAVVGIMASRSEGLSVSQSRGSRGSSKRTLSTVQLEDEDLLRGHFQIGALRYNTKDILGSGCEGTKVFRGVFDGRAVAVKRVVSDQIKLIDREIELLRRSDTHPNVVRYFCSETDDNFFYIALELCDCTLKDYVYNKSTQDRYAIDMRNILKQTTDGIAYLHSINIVHRDLKPQNILLTPTDDKRRVRVMISDFGLCKMVKRGHASVSKVSGLAGTEGWIAPEMMKSDLTSVTYAIDVFALGCVFYFVICDGKHPFGESNRRQDNILEGRFNLGHLTSQADYVALNAIEKMIEHDPYRRPPIDAVAAHPIFWSKERQLQFFMDVSDRIERLQEDDPLIQSLEAGSCRVLGTNDWHRQLSKLLRDDLVKFRKYQGHSIRDLMRAMRNKKHHYRELPEDLKKSLGDIPDEYLTYFTDRFPHLLIHTFKVMAMCADERNFHTYYPDESRSFCGRVLKESMEDAFEYVSHMQGSPRRQLPQRQMPGGYIAHVHTQPDLPAAAAGNWRDRDGEIPAPVEHQSYMPSQPPPGFETQQKTGRKRVRQRKKSSVQSVSFVGRKWSCGRERSGRSGLSGNGDSGSLSRGYF